MRLSIAAQRRIARIVPYAVIALAALGAVALTYQILH
jgi:hypothetical protein